MICSGKGPNMKKCVICQQNCMEPDETYQMAWDVIKTILNQMDCMPNWYELEETTTFHLNHIVPVICELCLIGMMNTNQEYIWDGTILLVYDGNDQEYHEYHGKCYKPKSTIQIQFEYDERRQKWIAMPR